MMHQLMAETLDKCVAEIKSIQADARKNGFTKRPRWPMIVLRTPKGWTGPKEVDGLKIEGNFRAHQVPMGDMRHPGAHQDPRRLDAELSARKNCSTRPANSCRSWPSWRPKASGAWAPTRTPTAACCSRI